MKKARMSILFIMIVVFVTSCKPSDIKELNKEAYKLYMSKDYSRSIESYTQAIEKHPEYSDFYMNRGMAYNEIGQQDLALQDFDQAIKLDSKNAEAFANRAYVNLALGYNNAALEDLNKAIEMKKQFSQKSSLYYVYLNMGTLKSMAGKKDEAIQWYDQAIKIRKDDPGVYNAKALVLKDLKQYDQALDYINQAIELDENFAYAYSSRASIYFLLGNYDIALADIETALKLDKNIPQLYLIKGQIYSTINHPEEAIKAYSYAIDQWPNYGEVYMQRGKEYEKIGNFTDALLDYTFATDYEINEAYKNKGFILIQIGQYKDGVNSLNKYLTLVGDDIEVKQKIEFAKEQ